MSSLLKEGDELYIKESNGKVRKIDEVISLEDGIKIPKAIFDEFGKVNAIKLKQHGMNIKGNVNFKEINKELMDCLSNQTDPTLWKIDNFTVHNLDNLFIPIPITTNVPPSSHQSCHKPPPLPKNILLDVQRLAKKNGGFIDSRTIESELRGNSKPSKKLEPEEVQVWNDESILKHIIDSLSQLGIDNNITITCDFNMTEKQAKIELANYYSKTRLLVLYVWIILPLFIIFYIQNEMHNNSFSKSAKVKKRPKNTTKDTINIGGFGNVMLNKLLSVSGDNPPILQKIRDSNLLLLKDTDNNLSPYAKILMKIYYFLTGNEFPTMPPCDVYRHLDIQEKLAANFSEQASCKEDNDISCPNHSHLYSTDEASSSEADFVGSHNSKSGKGKAKKNKRDVKKNR
jgi:hypothetical protein